MQFCTEVKISGEIYSARLKNTWVNISVGCRQLLRASADFCGIGDEHLRTSADFCGIGDEHLRTSAGLVTNFCGLLRTSADFCGLLRTSADFCGLLRTSADFCGPLRASRHLCGTHPECPEPYQAPSSGATEPSTKRNQKKAWNFQKLQNCNYLLFPVSCAMTKSKPRIYTLFWSRKPESVDACIRGAGPSTHMLGQKIKDNLKDIWHGC